MAIRNRIIGRGQVLKHVSMSDISHWTQQGVSARCGVGTVVIRVLERRRRRKEEKDEAGKSDVIANGEPLGARPCIHNWRCRALTSRRQDGRGTGTQ